MQVQTYSYKSHFPQLNQYLSECYVKGLFKSDIWLVLGPLVDYMNALTIWFLFTNVPDHKPHSDLTHKYFLPPSFIQSYREPIVTATHLLEERLFQPCSIFFSLDVSDLALTWTGSLSSVWWTEIRSIVSTRDDQKVLDLMDPYYDELVWFEIYAAVYNGTHTLDFKETPAIKLYYPEPFVATPSFVHEDVWFLHILLYAHWLWFFFISLIILFFITFINAVRWCNYRVRPKRETRGVSRSKCADLITACVPVSWAISIIISESTDAVDYYDGFGTGELILGIRAYQWGWQYYYPKGMDLSYNVTPTYNSFIGKSLNSSTNSSTNPTSVKLWRHYQSSDLNNFSSNPSTVFLSPSNNIKFGKFIDTTSVGGNNLKSTDAFKQVQQFSKINYTGLFAASSELTARYTKLKTLYADNYSTTDSITYGTRPQHNFSNTMASQSNSNTHLEPLSLKTYLNYVSGSSYTPAETVNLTLTSLTDTRVLNNLQAPSKYYFTAPTTYVDYDLTNYKHARQVESLFWESKTNLAHPYSNTKKLETTYETYYKWVTSQTEAKLSFRDSFVSLPSKYVTLSPSFLPFSSSNLGFQNPALLNTIDYNKFFTKTFVENTRFEYESYKNWLSLLGLSGSHSLTTIMTKLKPIQLTNSLDLYALTTRTKYSTNNLYLPLDLLLHNDYSGKINNRTRFSNSFSTRGAAKESITTYNALRKVFKARFDENRANLRLKTISGLNVTAPYINMPKVNFENLLSKNSAYFVSKVTYQPKLQPNFSQYWVLDSLLNFYMSDLPFLKSLKSDASRYIWFDWGSRWERIEVQPSSIARYSLLGVPYSQNKFIYDTYDGPKSTRLNNSTMLESENYFTRLSRSRKNYITTWAYSPYLYTRLVNLGRGSTLHKSFKVEHSLVSHSNNDVVLWGDFKLLMRLSKWTWTRDLTPQNPTLLPPQASTPLNTPGRAFTEPWSGLGKYTHLITKTTALLSKREEFYHYYLRTQGYSTILPAHVITHVGNPVLKILKAHQPLLDPTRSGPEGYQVFKNHYPSNYLALKYLRTYFKNTPTTLIPESTRGYILDSVVNVPTTNLQKNQYRPMRKGITSMVRLHATGAVALPTEIRIHILASSKDVIHSWAIPSAGIKIDCIPGYSSHRVVIFFNSGIYWGQCMEICGRFHHWMPIVLYIMKRDAFFIWVTHFIHYSKQLASFTNTANLTSTPKGNLTNTKPFYSYTLAYPVA